MFPISSSPLDPKALPEDPLWEVGGHLKIWAVLIPGVEGENGKHFFLELPKGRNLTHGTGSNPCDHGVLYIYQCESMRRSVKIRIKM